MPRHFDFRKITEISDVWTTKQWENFFTVFHRRLTFWKMLFSYHCVSFVTLNERFSGKLFTISKSTKLPLDGTIYHVLWAICIKLDWFIVIGWYRNKNDLKLLNRIYYYLISYVDTMDVRNTKSLYRLWQIIETENSWLESVLFRCIYFIMLNTISMLLHLYISVYRPDFGKKDRKSQFHEKFLASVFERIMHLGISS